MATPRNMATFRPTRTRGDEGMDQKPSRGHRQRGPRTRPTTVEADRGRVEEGSTSYSATTQYISTIPAHQQPDYPGDADMEIKLHSVHSLERHGDGGKGQIKKHQRRRPHCLLCLFHGLYDVGFHFWKSIDHETGGDLTHSPGHLRASIPRLHARPADRRTDEQLPSGNRRQGYFVPPAPVADAGFLAVPDRLDGPWGPVRDLFARAS